uniref:Uncharacterized protein n=1 Tax=Ovis aries TaxID=9940 RepID=A0AC11B1Q8_SHEEP
CLRKHRCLPGSVVHVQVHSGTCSHADAWNRAAKLRLLQERKPGRVRSLPAWRVASCGFPTLSLLLLPHRRHHGSHARSREGPVPVGSALPPQRAHRRFLSREQWLKLTSDDVKEQIYKLAKKGLTPSQIGVILRDSHGVAQVRFVTGNKILRILKSKGLAPDLPEDLYHLIKKAVAVRKHLERNRKDKDAKFRLILIESRIHRLARYYKTKRVLPPNWKYESSTASALVA